MYDYGSVSSSWGYWAEVRNEVAVLEGTYTRGKSIATRTNTLKSIDLDKIMNHSWNDEAKKILILSSANAFSMAQTNETFKTFVESNDIQVLYSGDLSAIKVRPFDNGTPKSVLKEGSTYYIDTYEGIKYAFDPDVQDYPVQVNEIPESSAETIEDKVNKSKALSSLGINFAPYPSDHDGNKFAAYYSGIYATPYNKDNQHFKIPFVSGTRLNVVVGDMRSFKDKNYRSYDATFVYKQHHTLATNCKEILGYKEGLQGVPNLIFYKTTDDKFAVWSGNIGYLSTREITMRVGSRWYTYMPENYIYSAYIRSTKSLTTSTFKLSDVEMVQDEYGTLYFYDDANGEAWKTTSTGVVKIATGYSSRNGFRLLYQDGSFQIYDVKPSLSYGFIDGVRFTELTFGFVNDKGELWKRYPYSGGQHFRFQKAHYADSVVRSMTDFIVFLSDRGIEYTKFLYYPHGAKNETASYPNVSIWSGAKAHSAFLSNGVKYYVGDGLLYSYSPYSQTPLSDNLFPRRFDPDEGVIPFVEVLTTSPNNVSFTNDADMINHIISDNVGQTGYRTLTVVVNDEVEISSIAEDYENDPIKQIAWDFTHNPSYFENSSTVHPQSGVSMTEPITDFSYPGEYIASVKGIDDTIHDRYDKWSVNSAEYKIYAHRLPTAISTYNLQETELGYQAAFDGRESYDLDHESQANNGIVEYEYKYRTIADSDWNESTGSTLLLEIEKNVQYDVFFRVKDLEGAHSDWKHTEIKIVDEPFELNATVDPAHPNAVPASETINVDAEVITTKDIQSVTATFDGTPFTLSYVSTSGMSKLYKGKYVIPPRKVDFDPCDVVVTAEAVDGTTDINRLSVNVETPINLSGFISPDDVTKGQTVLLTAKTSKYATSTKATLFYGTSYAVTKTLSGTVSGVLKNWSTNYKLTQNTVEGDYDVKFDSQTANGNSESYIDTYHYDPNSAPTILIKNKNQSSIFKGESVTITCVPRDIDGDRLNVMAEYSLDGGNTWHLVDTLLLVPQGSTQSFTVKNVDIFTYDIRITAFDPKGASGFDTDVFTVTPNQPPTIAIQSISPTTIYEGDDVTISVLVNDPDGDDLIYRVEVSEDNGSEWNVIETKTVSSDSIQETVLTNVNEITYSIRVSVYDPFGEDDIDQTTFSVNAMEITTINTSPTPVKAGLWVTFNAETIGYADQCYITLNGGNDNGLIIYLTNENPTTNLSNQWSGQYQTYKFEADGNLPFNVTALRGVRVDRTTSNIVISGSYLEDTVPSVKE